MNIDPARGLVLRLPNPLGDFCSSEPLVDALYEAFRARGAERELALAGPLGWLELLSGRFAGARRIALPASGAEGPRLYARPAGGAPVGVALLLPGSLRSALAAFRARVPRRIGVARDGRGWLLTDALRPAAECGAASRGNAAKRSWSRVLPQPPQRAYADLAGRLGLGVSDRAPRLRPTADVQARVDARLLSDVGERPFVLVNAGGAPGSPKSLSPAEAEPLLANLARELPEHALLLATAPAELARGAELHERLTRRLPGRALLGFADRAALPAELLALAHRAALGVTTDTGPLHLMRAAGLPRLCLIGPTDPRHSAAYDPELELRLRLELPCSPCQRGRCPLEGPDERRCLRGFDAQDAAAQASALLACRPAERASGS